MQLYVNIGSPFDFWISVKVEGRNDVNIKLHLKIYGRYILAQILVLDPSLHLESCHIIPNFTSHLLKITHTYIKITDTNIIYWIRITNKIVTIYFPFSSSKYMSDSSPSSYFLWYVLFTYASPKSNAYLSAKTPN